MDSAVQIFNEFLELFEFLGPKMYFNDQLHFEPKRPFCVT